MKPHIGARAKAPIEIQTLEDRRLLTVFGNAWPDARNLNVSFPADGVQVGTYQNDAGSLLDTLAGRQQWQELALRAYQMWAIHADINVGLRNDYNNEFGTPGRVVGDPRFGEFRIGAFPQEGLVASSVPFQAVAGTYSGDLILNSNEKFTFHDWDDNLAPDPATIGELDRDLFSLLLHESGNTLGLNDNLMDWSVMFRQYTVPKGVLTAQDIASIQSIYGERSDPYEQVDNGQLKIASLVHTPVGLDPGTEVIRTRGSLQSGDDVDYYKVIPSAGLDQVTIRVRASGVSLLKSRLEIVDSAGRVIQQTDVESVFENDNVLTIKGIQNQAEVYVRISAADPDDVYSVGDYWLEVDYREIALQASDASPGGYDSGPDSLFANYELIDDELGANDSVANAVVVAEPANGSTDRYEFESSVSSARDLDFFKVTAPDVIEGRMIVHVVGVGTDSPDMRLRVVDASGQAVGSAARLRPDGTFTVEVARPEASRDYFVRVSVDPNSTVGIGNYVAVAEFETPDAQMNHLAKGDVATGVDRYIRWNAAKTKLFRFDLSATSSGTDQAVRLTVYDAHTREIKMVAVSQAGVTRSVLGWLQQGEYILRFTAVSTGGAPVTGASYSLTADGLSDDQDEDAGDPSDDPEYDPYDYNEPSGEYEYEYLPGDPYGDPYYSGY